MHPAWRTLLQKTSLEDDPYGAAHFGDPSTESAMLLGDGTHCPLPGVGVIQVRGEDARAFLHAQLTQDIESLETGEARLAGYCNPKGRLLAVLQVLLADDGYLLLAERGLLDSLIRRLRMYILRSRVSLDDVTGQYQAIGVAGGRMELLTDVVGTLPDAPGRVHQAGDLLAFRPFSSESVLLLATAHETPSLWERLQAAGPPAGPQAWRLLAIRHGLPAVYPETIESFVPQQVNLEITEGVHFRKGCYPGQEVVARMHYLGRPSRRMYRFGAGHGHLPAAGVRISDGDDRTAGTVVQAAIGPEETELLAVLRTACEGRQDLTAEGLALSPRDLPYDPNPEA